MSSFDQNPDGQVVVQAAQRHHARHETAIWGRFAGPDKLVYLIGNGEAPPRRWWGFTERLDRTGQIGDDFTDGNQLVSFVSPSVLSCLFKALAPE